METCNEDENRISHERAFESNFETNPSIQCSSIYEHDIQWRREVILKDDETGHVRKYIRSQSLTAFHQKKYSAGDIRHIRERLLGSQKHSETASTGSFSKKQKLALICLAVVDFISFCSMSIMAPFFPKEASKKGMSEAVSGLVFSFYALVMFIASPIFGKILPVVGTKFLYMSGMFVAGCCNILFGLLAHIESYMVFTLYCFLVRGMEALGASAYATASYVFVVDIFPENIGSVLGILETFVGLGMSIGPALGGVLYAVGGFALPFYTLGVVMVTIVPLNFCLLPPASGTSVTKDAGSLLTVLKLPSVIVLSLIVIIVSNTWGFLDPTLEPHLREYQLSPEKIGLVFLLFSATYGISSPLWGWLADRFNNHWSMMVCGLFLCAVGLLLLGPSPFLPFLPKTLWLNLVALSLLGMSVALALLPTFQAVLDSSIDGGCRDELSTYSLVAGIWSCLYSLGEVTGPSLGGFLLTHYGFPMAATVMAGLTLLLAIFALFFFSLRTINYRSRTTTQETSSDSGVCEEWGEHSPLLYGSLDHDLHCRNRVEYYTENDRISDIRRTVIVTARGACEV